MTMAILGEDLLVLFAVEVAGGVEEEAFAFVSLEAASSVKFPFCFLDGKHIVELGTSR